jgi:hypothetical protein
MADQITVNSIEVHEVRAEAADLRKLRRHGAEMSAPLPEIAYVVKLYLEKLPPADALGYELYVGAQKIRKYSQFKDGIYFKVTNPAELQVYQNQKVRFRRPGSDEFIETDVSFPVLKAEISGAKAPSPRSLPTARDVLRDGSE